MFIINTISPQNAKGKIKEIYNKTQENLGFIPAHTELFATLDINGLEEFLNLNMYLKDHKKIDFNLLPFLRLYISKTECRGYCTTFNTKLLLVKGIKKDFIKNIQNEFENIPFDKGQIVLATKTIKALYEPLLFCKDDLEELYSYGFDDKDFYDLVNYATIFLAKSKIIEIYLKDK